MNKARIKIGVDDHAYIKELVNEVYRALEKEKQFAEYNKNRNLYHKLQNGIAGLFGFLTFNELDRDIKRRQSSQSTMGELNSVPVFLGGGKSLRTELFRDDRWKSAIVGAIAKQLHELAPEIVDKLGISVSYRLAEMALKRALQLPFNGPVIFILEHVDDDAIRLFDSITSPLVQEQRDRLSGATFAPIRILNKSTVHQAGVDRCLKSSEIAVQLPAIKAKAIRHYRYLFNGLADGGVRILFVDKGMTVVDEYKVSPKKISDNILGDYESGLQIGGLITSKATDPEIAYNCEECGEIYPTDELHKVQLEFEQLEEDKPLICMDCLSDGASNYGRCKRKLRCDGHYALLNANLSCPTCADEEHLTEEEAKTFCHVTEQWIENDKHPY